MKMSYNPHARRLVFAGSPKQLDAFLQNQPRVLPPPPAAAPHELPLHWRLIACLLTLSLFPLALLGCLLLGERSHRVPPPVPTHLQHLKK